MTFIYRIHEHTEYDGWRVYKEYTSVNEITDCHDLWYFKFLMHTGKEYVKLGNIMYDILHIQ